jgi:hypothetical protein
MFERTDFSVQHCASSLQICQKLELPMQNSYKPCSLKYTGCIKKTEQIWNCSQFRKTAISIQLLMYIASLDTYNVE